MRGGGGGKSKWGSGGGWGGEVAEVVGVPEGADAFLRGGIGGGIDTEEAVGGNREFVLIQTSEDRDGFDEPLGG